MTHISLTMIPFVAREIVLRKNHQTVSVFSIRAGMPYGRELRGTDEKCAILI